MAEAKGSYVGGTPVYFKDEKARAMLSNEYVPAENYAAGNLCIHEGKLYKATKATTGTWDATAWTETNLAEVNAGMQKSITDLTEKMKYTKDVKYESVSINSDGYGIVEMGIEQNEKIIGANIMTWNTGTLYGGPTIGNNGNGYGYIFGKPNSTVTDISIRWRVVKI